MKCALEMAIAIEEAKRLEEIKKEEERKEKYQANLKEFYANIENLDTYVENKLLEKKGKVELIFEEAYGNEGFYHFGELNYDYKYRNGGFPYYYLRPVAMSKFPLEIYVEYLKSHCYIVEIEDATFTGVSSTGKTERKVKCSKMIISIQ